MIKGLSANKLQARGVTDRTHQLFVQRWTELFALRTIDSYRVSAMNSRTILLELQDTIEQVFRHVVRDSHIADLKAEAACLVRESGALLGSLSDKRGPLCKALSDQQENAHKLRVLTHRLGTANEYLKREYWDHAWDVLYNAMATGDEVGTYAAVAPIAVDCINRQWSSQALFELGHTFCQEPHDGATFQEWLVWLREGLGSEPRTYNCLFRLRSHSRVSKTLAPSRGLSRASPSLREVSTQVSLSRLWTHSQRAAVPIACLVTVWMRSCSDSCRRTDDLYR